MSQRSVRFGIFPDRVGKASRDIGRCSAQTWLMAPPARTGNWLHVLAAGLGVFVLLEVIAAAVLSAHRRMVLAGRPRRLRCDQLRDRAELSVSAAPSWPGIVRAIRLAGCSRPAAWLIRRRRSRHRWVPLLHDAAAPIAVQRLADHDLRLVLAVGDRTVPAARAAALPRWTPPVSRLAVGRDRCDRYRTACSRLEMGACPDPLDRATRSAISHSLATPPCNRSGPPPGGVPPLRSSWAWLRSPSATAADQTSSAVSSSGCCWLSWWR